MALSSLSYAQTRKLAPELNTNSAISKTKSVKQKSVRKINVDLSTVPTLGTEAGVSSPGSPISYYTPSNRYSTQAVNGTSGVNTNRNYVESDNGSGGQQVLTSISGLLSVFTKASNLGNRIGSAGVPMFSKECKDCLKTGAGQVTVLGEVGDEVSDEYNEEISVVGGGTGIHDPNAILEIVKNESLVAFKGITPDSNRLGYIDTVIASLDTFGVLVLQNVEEYKAMCPNYENLSADQRKAFMVFMYSELFKQNSNYSNAQKIPVTIDGKNSFRIGMCSLEFNEMKSIFDSYGVKFTASEEVFNTHYATEPRQNIWSCSAKILSATSTPSDNQTIKKMFPKNYDQVSAQLKNLNMCK